MGKIQTERLPDAACIDAMRVIDDCKRPDAPLATTRRDLPHRTGKGRDVTDSFNTKLSALRSARGRKITQPARSEAYEVDGLIG